VWTLYTTSRDLGFGRRHITVHTNSNNVMYIKYHTTTVIWQSKVKS